MSRLPKIVLDAVSVVPVVEFVFKSVKGLYNNLETFKRYIGEAKRVQRELEVQEAIFKNEWRILKTFFSPNDDNNVLNTTNDASRRKLHKFQLDQRLREALGENYNACEKAIGVIGEDLHELGAELQEIHLLTAHQENERPSDTVRRLREVQGRLKITFGGKKWSKSIEKLRRSIANLSTLRAQLERLGEPARPKVPVEGKASRRYLMERRGSVTVQRASRA
ncbi:hypothetical protein EDB81DRAFT_912204 [Dactylonectria macrodidyma]|uniref:Uncharacterized protein n=1 Tax=Dactylonectria macrodidyma TaxID=307937 RepID=A0A9P9IM26_9HYPO|nr:hypothetical protein EDB81DRAFT_912204 [Dactylonectria macrodidyma]